MKTRTGRSRWRGTVLLFGTLLVFVLLSGCMSFNPASLRGMDEELMAHNPDLVVESSMRFGVGALTLDFIDFAFVHERELDISKISRADIGIYEVSGMLALDAFHLPPANRRDRHCPRRDVIMRIRDESDYVQVTACIRGERVTGLSVFVLEPGEIVVINARGNFEALISRLLREHMHPGDNDTDVALHSGRESRHEASMLVSL